MKQKSSLLHRLFSLAGDSSPLMTAVGKAMLLVVLNLCWLLCSLPLVTVGAASTALYSILLERGEHSYLSAVPAFFRAFRRCFRTATCLWLPYLLTGAALLFDFSLLLQHEAVNNPLLLTPLLLSAALWGMTQLWLHPLLALNSELRPVSALRESFLAALRELWRSLAGLAILAVPLVVFLLYGKLFVQLLPLWVLAGSSLSARLALLLTEPVLKP
ncbi:MAG: DUF624 domain-containing protein [Oscillibacter sp.]|nr:DUF624 domain-containing protein [Oscillibacter sp.]